MFPLHGCSNLWSRKICRYTSGFPHHIPPKHSADTPDRSPWHGLCHRLPDCHPSRLLPTLPPRNRACCRHTSSLSPSRGAIAVRYCYFCLLFLVRLQIFFRIFLSHKRKESLQKSAFFRRISRCCQNHKGSRCHPASLQPQNTFAPRRRAFFLFLQMALQ